MNTDYAQRPFDTAPLSELHEIDFLLLLADHADCTIMDDDGMLLHLPRTKNRFHLFNGWIRQVA